MSCRHSGTGWMLLLVMLMLPLSGHAVERSTDPFVENPATPALLKELHQGGFVLYMRHGATDSSYPDQVPIDLNDCNTQRPLCRAHESAQLAYGDNITIVHTLMYTAHLA